MIGAGSITNTASAQVYVSVRPVWHPVVRPVAPSPRHVWIDEEWAWRNGAYVQSAVTGPSPLIRAGSGIPVIGIMVAGVTAGIPVIGVIARW